MYDYIPMEQIPRHLNLDLIPLRTIYLLLIKKIIPKLCQKMVGIISYW